MVLDSEEGGSGKGVHSVGGEQEKGAVEERSRGLRRRTAEDAERRAPKDEAKKRKMLDDASRAMRGPAEEKGWSDVRK